MQATSPRPIETRLIPGARHAPHLEAKDATLAAITRFIAAPAHGHSVHMIDFQTDPSRYRHWRLSFDGPVATLTMDVDPAGGLMDGYELKLNSYDLGVDIELADAVQRLRFEHPEVRLRRPALRPRTTCSAPAPISACSASASHGHKVNFCKFTNETRLAIEDASRELRPDLPGRDQRHRGRRRL